jgi:hypothetical protein
MKINMENDGLILKGEKRSTRRKNPFLVARLYTTNLTSTALGSNPGIRGERMATNRLTQLLYIMFKIFSPCRAVKSVLGLKTSSHASILKP